MTSLPELTTLIRPLLRVSSRRIGAYSQCHRLTQTPCWLSYPRRHLSRHSRFPVTSAVGLRYNLRPFHSTPINSKDDSGNTSKQEPPPKAGPKPGGNDPNEVFTDMNVLSGVPPPASAIECVYEDGFLLNNGMRFSGKDGIIIVHNEAFNWLSHGAARVRNGVLELDEDLWGVLDVVAPKPELLILGTGARSIPISPRVKNHLHLLGIRIDSMDTNNAASQYNMLATERPGQIVATALLPAFFRS
ncbi:hypothetical protein TWF225_008733 [Orbilia oligospora]|uniref:Uncharacterized protein n=1 Tax=Orbilia oligospora TaxID=2813651 RepID=A0A7C8P6T0_ORBOL|nr:hypothetical protein TWF751_007855 [Orbilia oligospora]KAF3176274.1 hypothetical protein TWF225_008733 [Orbilia oligospora]KAF3237599.1 hypothetical protein TWF128_000875 [Orbilia oligospora]KAF3241193.1 hypothetical protein TWF217_000615 [Orbilia oligospora]KAF3291823.1 hypothetical protein TWF132_006563 [Orbilia oligospora]